MDLLLGVFFAFLSAICWALSDFLITTILKKENPEKIFFYSQLIGSVILVAVYFLFFNTTINFTTDLVILLLTAGLANVLSYLFFYKGLQVGKLSIIAPISSCWIVVTLVISTFILGEILTFQQTIGIIICIFGVLLTSFKLSNLIKLDFSTSYMGINYAFLTALMWGILFVLLGLLNSSLSWFIPVLLIRLISLVYISAYLKAKKQAFSIDFDLIPKIILIGLLDAFAFVAYNLAISSAFTSIIAPLVATFPVFTLILARIFLKETLDWNQIIGIALALSGIYILLS